MWKIFHLVILILFQLIQKKCYWLFDDPFKCQHVFKLIIFALFLFTFKSMTIIIFCLWKKWKFLLFSISDTKYIKWSLEIASRCCFFPFFCLKIFVFLSNSWKLIVIISIDFLGGLVCLRNTINCYWDLIIFYKLRSILVQVNLNSWLSNWKIWALYNKCWVGEVQWH